MPETDGGAGALQYPESVLLVGAAQSVWNGSKALVRIEMEVSGKLENRMAGEGIVPLECVFITDSDMRHIRRRHSRGEEPRGQVSLAPGDFAVLPEVLNDFDTCERTGIDKLGNKLFLLSKEIDGTWYVVTVQRGKRKLQVKTMWKRSLPGASC
jgi:hypothetical protein